MTTAAAGAEADSVSGREQQIKAAFVYNFPNFIDRPQEKMQDGNGPITIKITGETV